MPTLVLLRYTVYMHTYIFRTIYIGLIYESYLHVAAHTPQLIEISCCLSKSSQVSLITRLSRQLKASGRVNFTLSWLLSTSLPVFLQAWPSCPSPVQAWRNPRLPEIWTRESMGLCSHAPWSIDSQAGDRSVCLSVSHCQGILREASVPTPEQNNTLMNELVLGNRHVCQLCCLTKNEKTNRHGVLLWGRRGFCFHNPWCDCSESQIFSLRDICGILVIFGGPTVLSDVCRCCCCTIYLLLLIIQREFSDFQKAAQLALCLQPLTKKTTNIICNFAAFLMKLENELKVNFVICGNFAQ